MKSVNQSSNVFTLFALGECFQLVLLLVEGYLVLSTSSVLSWTCISNVPLLFCQKLILDHISCALIGLFYLVHQQMLFLHYADLCSSLRHQYVSHHMPAFSECACTRGPLLSGNKFGKHSSHPKNHLINVFGLMNFEL